MRRVTQVKSELFLISPDTRILGIQIRIDTDDGAYPKLFSEAQTEKPGYYSYAQQGREDDGAIAGWVLR